MRTVSCLLAVLVLTSCSPTLTLSADLISVVAGGDSVAISAALSGAAGTVDWSLAGPGSLNQVTGLTVIYTPPNTIASDPTLVYLTATAGDISAVATIYVSLPPNAFLVNPVSFTVTPGGDPVGLSAVLFDAVGDARWLLTGPGTVNPSQGSMCTYTPPASLAEATTAQVTAYDATLGVTTSADILVDPAATAFICCYIDGTVVGSWSCPTQATEEACCGDGSELPGCETDAGECTQVATSSCP